MKIIREHNVWRTNTNNAFISYDVKRKGRNTNLYILARVGDGTYWCEDAKGFVYSFNELISGLTQAPAYMTRLAKRVKRDLDATEQSA